MTTMGLNHLRQTLLFGIGFLIVSAFVPIAGAQDHELPIFPKDYADEFVLGEDPFVVVMEAYHANEFARAIQEVEQLLPDLPPGGPSAEAAAFLLGDLYFKLGAKGNKEALRKAVAAFQKAGYAYPKSENAIRGFWRMGQASAKLKLYPEAIGNYNRILRYHPNSQYVGLAHLGIGHVLRTQGKWKEAQVSYKKAASHKLSPSDQNALLIGNADVLYHLESYEEAYKSYNTAARNRPDYWKGEPSVLLQHGEMAQRMGRYGEARKALMLFFNIYGNEPLAPVALAMAGDTLRHEKKNREAQKIYNIVRTFDKATPGVQAAKLLMAVGEMLGSECAPASMLKNSQNHCLEEAEQKNADEARVLDTIGDEAKTLLKKDLPPLTLNEILLEAAKLHRKHGSYDTAIAIENKLLLRLPGDSTPFRKKLTSELNDTMSDAINEAAVKQDDVRIVQLFYTYPSAFTPKMLTGSTGMLVAEKLLKVGLYSQSLDLYEPISVSVANPFAESALIQLGKLLMQQGDYARARGKFMQFLARYSRSKRVPDVKVFLAELSDYQGEKEKAILEYQGWLRLYPKHPDHERVSLKLAKLFQNKRDFKNEIDVYLRLIKTDSQKHAWLYLRVADGYYLLKDYKKAADFYQLVLKTGVVGSRGNWAQLQLANCYQALGKHDEGKAIYVRLEQDADDLLIKKVASEKAMTRF